MVLTNCTFLLNRREDVFERADQFLPGRFLEKTCPRTTTFGGGNRMCAGRNLALMATTIVLATIVDRLDLQTVAPGQTPLAKGIHLIPRDGLKVLVKDIA
jgi:cytochrome P450